MKIDCDICRNLIPLYIENLLTAPTATTVKNHLNTCPACQEYLKNCRNPLPDITLTVDEKKEAILIKEFNLQFNFSKWMFFICGIFLSILFPLSDDLLQHMIFLPFIGLLGYLLTRKTKMMPIIISIILTLTIVFKDALQGSFDSFWGYILYLVIFYFLTLAGTLCGVLLHKISSDFMSQSIFRKIQTLLAWGTIAFSAGTILYFQNLQNGNPFTACYAQFQMQHYISKTYPDATIKLNNAHYNRKGSYYSTKARLFTEETANPFTLYYRKGNVWDDYFTLYLEDEPNEYRINAEIHSAVGNLLKDAHIPYQHISSELKLIQGASRVIHFNPSTFDQDFSLKIYNLTDTKQDYEAFSSWCETIRNLLISNGYHLADLTLESDPHSMYDRLSLTLSQEELLLPIEDVSKFKHFTDYSKLNESNEIIPSTEIGYEKIDFYYNEALSSEITSLLQDKNLGDIYVEAYLNDANELDLSIYMFGPRVSIDHFAQNTSLIMECLKTYRLFEKYKVVPLLMKYGWGTSSQSYSYTLYDDQIIDYSPEYVIQYLLLEREALS